MYVFRLCKNVRFESVNALQNQLVHKLRSSKTSQISAAFFGTNAFPFFDSQASEFLQQHLGLPGSDVHDHKVTTAKRFPDGGQFRIEIPSTEGVASFKAVIEESKKYNVPIHRVSQGSGITMMPKGEILDMLKIGLDNRIEVCLFVTPRNSWDIGAVAKTEAVCSISSVSTFIFSTSFLSRFPFRGAQI